MLYILFKTTQSSIRHDVSTVNFTGTVLYARIRIKKKKKKKEENSNIDMKTD